MSWPPAQHDIPQGANAPITLRLGAAERVKRLAH